MNLFKRAAAASESGDDNASSDKEARNKRAKWGSEQTICLQHLAGLLGIKDQRDRLYACTYGGGQCRFRHPECMKDAGTRSELLSIMENSRIANKTLQVALVGAIKILATDSDTV